MSLYNSKNKNKSYLSLTDPCNPKDTGHPFFINTVNLYGALKGLGIMLGAGRDG